MPTTDGMPGGYATSGTQGSLNMEDPSYGERGYRRRKLAAMAGNLYRSGQQAVTEMREQYSQSRGYDGSYESPGSPHIPGAFPDVAITVHGNDQMVIFPSYAKRHVKQDRGQAANRQPQQTQGSLRDEDFWRQEWEKAEDEKAVVDVDVRGWVYSPTTGPMTRRNRILLGLARQLSGIPAPRAEQQQASEVPDNPIMAHHQMHEEKREQERIDQEAAMIEKKGQEEKTAAYEGRYTERSRDSGDDDADSTYPRSNSSSRASSVGPPGHKAPQRSSTGTSTDMSEAEKAVANANLMARVAPFMTNPLVALPITMFFYNDSHSQSRTVMTNDAGHFVVRAPLDFVPTNVRVLANETLSAIQDVHITEPNGVSVISDIDDTIKRSNISGGAREIFRNTFVRDLSELPVDGVKEWYTAMAKLDVSFHYCSNSPWQLFPVLATYFQLAGLPPGSLHLKQYSGMLQGIFEPVAERKRGTLQRLLHDFPDRKFLLVGDSGEADLEVYTELALEYPHRILAIFIRDVTTPLDAGFFDSGYDAKQRKAGTLKLNDGSSVTAGPSRQSSDTVPTPASDVKASHGPVMGTLIDFSEEPQQGELDDKTALSQLQSLKPSQTASTTDLLSVRKRAPPRPRKPVALRATTSNSSENSSDRSENGEGTAPPVPPRKPAVSGETGRHPLANVQNSSQQPSMSEKNGNSGFNSGILSTASNSLIGMKNAALGTSEDRSAPPPPPPRRRVNPSNPRVPPHAAATGAGHISSSNGPSPAAPSAPARTASPRPDSAAGFSSRSSERSSSPIPAPGPNGPSGGGTQVLNKKVELWRRRLARAHEQLDARGISLYTWRRGQDVIAEALGLVKAAKEDMQRKGKDMKDLEKHQRRDQQGY